MSQPIQVCSLRRVPQDLTKAARRLALQERPSNSGAKDGEGRLAFPIQRMWKPGASSASASPTARPPFTWVDSGDTEIRISVGDGGGSWSYLGTDNGTIPQDQKTIKFGWLKDDSPDHEISRVVLHEFDHALG